MLKTASLRGRRRDSPVMGGRSSRLLLQLANLNRLGMERVTEELDGPASIGVFIDLHRLGMACPGHNPQLTLPDYSRSKRAHCIQTDVSVITTVNK